MTITMTVTDHDSEPIELSTFMEMELAFEEELTDRIFGEVWSFEDKHQVPNRIIQKALRKVLSRYP